MPTLTTEQLTHNDVIVQIAELSSQASKAAQHAQFPDSALGTRAKTILKAAIENGDLSTHRKEYRDALVKLNNFTQSTLSGKLKQAAAVLGAQSRIPSLATA